MLLVWFLSALVWDHIIRFHVRMSPPCSHPFFIITQAILVKHKEDVLAHGNQRERLCRYLFAFALTWSLGGNCDDASRPKFHEFVAANVLPSLLDKEDVPRSVYVVVVVLVRRRRRRRRHRGRGRRRCCRQCRTSRWMRTVRVIGIHIYMSTERLRARLFCCHACAHHTFVFVCTCACVICISFLRYDVALDVAGIRFVPWNTLRKEFTFPPVDASFSFFDIMVPTADTTRYTFLLDALLKDGHHTLLMGESGVGKSVIVQQFLNATVAPEDAKCV
jgi:hypothetical protein